MNVLLVNGSPHANGCTYTALEEVAKTLNTEGIETQIFQIGTKPLAGCIACKTCAKTGRCAFSDRVNDFLAVRQSFYLKPAAAVVSARRAGTTATFDQLNKYFTISEMPVIASRYWNMVHGATPEDVKKDLEGLQIMRILGRNMAWFLKCKEAGIKAGVPFPEREENILTNFIR